MQRLSVLMAEIQTALPVAQQRWAEALQPIQDMQAEVDAMLRPVRLLVDLPTPESLEEVLAGGALCEDHDPDLFACLSQSDEAERNGDFVECVFSEVPEQFGGEIQGGEVVRLLRNEFRYFEGAGVCRLATEHETETAVSGSPLRRHLALLGLAGSAGCLAS